MHCTIHVNTSLAIVGNGHTLKHANCMIIQYTYVHSYTHLRSSGMCSENVASVEIYSECDVSIAILFIQEGTAITTLI